MWIKRIGLKNYRNFDSFKLDFKPGLNVIHAPNGSGKTNIVEAVAYFSVPKSFRRALDKHLIKKSVFFEEINIEDLNEDILKTLSNFARGIGSVSIDEENYDMEFFIQHNSTTSKTLKINDLKKPLKEFVGRFYSVVFSPEIIDIVHGSPGNRRALLDRLISMYDSEYFVALGEYKKILKNRNKMLTDFNFIDENLLKVVNEQLVSVGAQILKSRILFFENLKPFIKKVGEEILKSDLGLEINYESTLKNLDLLTLEDEFARQLNESLRIDKRRGSTQIGPHRDDFNLYINTYSLKDFGSRGQQRMGILSLLVAYVLYLESEVGIPVLLLDDVFSELDQEHRKLLLDFIASKDFQVIITTTEVDHILDSIKDKINLIDLTNERI